jgi:hypothetical protein
MIKSSNSLHGWLAIVQTHQDLNAQEAFAAMSQLLKVRPLSQPAAW